MSLKRENDLTTSTVCYQTALEINQSDGTRRHVADCLLRLGIVLLLDGKIEEAKSMLMKTKRWYEGAEDVQGFQYTETILAECETNGLKVRR